MANNREPYKNKAHTTKYAICRESIQIAPFFSSMQETRSLFKDLKKYPRRRYTLELRPISGTEIDSGSYRTRKDNLINMDCCLSALLCRIAITQREASDLNIFSKST